MRGTCPVCGIVEGVENNLAFSGDYSAVVCPCCGSFFSNDLMDYIFNAKDKNKFSAYLYYDSSD